MRAHAPGSSDVVLLAVLGGEKVRLYRYQRLRAARSADICLARYSVGCQCCYF